MTTSLYAEQFKTRERMSSGALRAESRALLKWLFLAKVVNAGMVTLGFGCFFLIQLG